MTYQILPLRFERWNASEYFITNDVGEFIFLPQGDFESFVGHRLDTAGKTFLDLKAKHLATDTDTTPMIEMLATKFRTKKSTLSHFTSLHMVVPTLRCNSNCVYCQVSRKDQNDRSVDMSRQTAKRIVRTIFESPSPEIKIEFQGGEPLICFEMVRTIIEDAEWHNLFKKRRLEFVLCSNLSLLTPSIARYLKKHKCCVSTSLDGPETLHNANRPLQNRANSYAAFAENLRMCRDVMGSDSVSALMTTTCHNLMRFRDVVDEYVRLGFSAIFLRTLNPYGFAKRDKGTVAYPIESFIEQYKEALNYIIDLNLRGIYFVESFAELLLTRILTPFATGFVDLQSPAGVGISGVIYDYDGSVYVSDEARMMANMKDSHFRMGNVHTNTYQEMFNGEFLRNVIAQSCTECLPGCADCAFQPFCGADPVRNYSEQGDVVGHRPTNEMCKKTKAVIRHLLDLIKQNDTRINDVFWSWITRRPLPVKQP